MLEHIINCPICQNSSIEKHLTTKDYSISQEGFSLFKCNSCGFVFTNPRPNQDGIGKYYESEDYISHSNSNKGLLNKIYQLVRNYSLRKKLALVTKFSNSDKTILDIGCGTGSFLNICKNNGWSVSGIEPNVKARETAFKAFNIIAKDETGILSMPTESFQIITMWHVLEHVHLLRKRIEEVSFLLKIKGKVIIALPNLLSYDARHYNNFWAAYDVPRHLYHFSGQNIKDLLKQYNFQYLGCFPMKFDSFYVSILSEKYKRKLFPIIRGLFQGLKSNLSASNDSEKYSSVIYVFEKL